MVHGSPGYLFKTPSPTFSSLVSHKHPPNTVAKMLSLLRQVTSAIRPRSGSTGPDATPVQPSPTTNLLCSDNLEKYPQAHPITIPYDGAGPAVKCGCATQGACYPPPGTPTPSIGCLDTSSELLSPATPSSWSASSHLADLNTEGDGPNLGECSVSFERIPERTSTPINDDYISWSAMGMLDAPQLPALYPCTKYSNTRSTTSLGSWPVWS